MRKDKGPAMLLFAVLLVGLALPASAHEIVFENHSDLFPQLFTPFLSVAPNGSIIAVWTYQTTVRNEDRGIWIRYSDDGMSWNNSSRMIMSWGNGIQYWPTCLLTPGSKLIMFYDAKVYFDVGSLSLCNCTVWMIESYDNGETWVNARQIDGELHNYVLGTYQATILKNGTVIFPISWYMGNLLWSSAVLRSDDTCLSWIQGEPVTNPFESGTGLDEPAVVELGNGSLYCLMRAGSFAHPNPAYAVSDDCGLTWSQPKWVDSIQAMDSTPAMIRIHSMVIVAWVKALQYSPRRPLLLTYSNDDCNTWQTPVLIDSATDQEINDMAFCVAGDTLFLSYRRYSTDLNGNGIDDDAIIQTFTLIMSLMKADINKDGIVDLSDARILEDNFNTANSETDLMSDGITDLFDAIILSGQFGKNGWTIANN